MAIKYAPCGYGPVAEMPQVPSVNLVPLMHPSEIAEVIAQDDWCPLRRMVVSREAAILFTEDELLFWRLNPMPDADFDFQFADRFCEIAESHGQRVLGAPLVWDEGFGPMSSGNGPGTTRSMERSRS